MADYGFADLRCSARYLDVRSGRFWAMDEAPKHAKDPTKSHNFLFVENNPVNRFDRTGWESIGEEVEAAGLNNTLETLPNQAVRAGEQTLESAEQAINEEVADVETSVRELKWQEAEEATGEEIGGEGSEQFNPTNGIRRVDQYNPVEKIAAESKSGYVRYSERIAQQIEKDGQILKEFPDKVQQYEWHFWRSPYTHLGGPDGEVFNLLIQNGIKVIIH